MPSIRAEVAEELIGPWTSSKGGFKIARNLHLLPFLNTGQQSRIKNMRNLQNDAEKIAEKEKVLMAHSGGVDNSLLAKIARDILKENAFCVILDSEPLPALFILAVGNIHRRKENFPALPWD